MAGWNLRRCVDVQIPFGSESLYEIVEKLCEFFLGVFGAIAAKCLEKSQE